MAWKGLIASPFSTIEKEYWVCKLFEANNFISGHNCIADSFSEAYRIFSFMFLFKKVSYFIQKGHREFKRCYWGNSHTMSWKTLSNILLSNNVGLFFNTNEFGLFFQYVPSKSINLKRENSVDAKHNKLWFNELATGSTIDGKLAMFFIGNSVQNVSMVWKICRVLMYVSQTTQKVDINSLFFWVGDEDKLKVRSSRNKDRIKIFTCRKSWLNRPQLSSTKYYSSDQWNIVSSSQIKNVLRKKLEILWKKLINTL